MEDKLIRVFITDDLLALEYNDSIKLIFTTDRDDIITDLEDEEPPEFTRDTAIVFIIDNDGMNSTYEVKSYVYSFYSPPDQF